MIAAVLSVGMLTACQTQEAPSPPPTSQPALTTATPEPAPTTEAAPATEAAPTTAEPVATTSEPEMDPTVLPEAARQQTEAGAEAFAEFYLGLLNHTGLHPEVGVLEEHSEQDCKSCANFEENVQQLVDDNHRNDQEALQVGSAQAVDLGGETVVFIDVDQSAYSVIDENGEVVRTYEARTGQFKISLTSGAQWKVAELQVMTPQ